MSVRILLGDCMARLKDLPDNSVDSVVTDPPYHLQSIVKRFGGENAAPAQSKQTGVYARSSKGFMGQTWDGGDVAFRPETWAEVLRVLKPGGHLLAFSGTRTYHRMAVAIEDAGFEVRDMIAWHYGSGFPKSLDVSKAIDKAAGAEREVVGQGFRKNDRDAVSLKMGRVSDEFDITAPATDAAKQWQGYGTALKPATEPICLARKTLSEKSVAANVLKWGTGALSIDGCRIGTDGGTTRGEQGERLKDEKQGFRGNSVIQPLNAGRWPANLVHDGSDEVVAGFPADAGGGKPKEGGCPVSTVYNPGGSRSQVWHQDEGSAARFFYCAKATTEERGEGNNHPTVKPVALMRWLTRLVTPKGGVVLDPFMGSGSTALACDAEQFDFIGCELSADYAAIAEKRIRAAAGMFADVSVEHAGPNTRAAA